MTDERDSIGRWIDAKAIEGRSERTLRFYSDTAVRLMEFLGRDPIDATTQEIRTWLASLRDTCSNVTINNYRRNLNSYYAFLEDEDEIAKSPMRKIHFIKEDRLVKEPFTDEDMELIARAASRDVRDAALVSFLSTTACRVGEAVGVKIADVDLNEREVRVFGKGNKERITFFDAKTKVALEEYLATRSDDCPYLFASKTTPRRQLTTGAVERAIRCVGRSAGVKDCHPHRFRRTVATRAIDRGMPIEQVKELLGHSEIQTTMIYAKVSKSNVKASHRRYVA